MTPQRVSLSVVETGDRFRIPRRRTILTVRKVEKIGELLLVGGADESGRFDYYYGPATTRVELAGPCARDIRSALGKLQTELEHNLPALLAAADDVLDAIVEEQS